MPSARSCKIVAVVLAGFVVVMVKTPGHGQEEAVDEASVKVEDTPGREAKTLIFTAEAMERIGIQTEAVREVQVSKSRVAGAHKAVPHSAVTYDAEGNTWVYVNLASDTFMRVPVTIEFMDGDNVYLSTGPAVGEAVVTTGVPEMAGAEFGVGEGE
jgi:hypothetical protein